MAIDYFNAGGVGLFDILGKIFNGMKVKNTARGTTVANAVAAAIAQYKLKTNSDLELDRDIQGLASAELSDRTGDGLLSSYQNMAQALLKGVVRADSNNERLSLESSMQYLIDQMIADAFYVDNSLVTTAVTPDAGNSASDLNIYVTDIGSAGLEINHIYTETMQAEVTTGGSSPSLQFTGARAARSKLAEDWPAGSGVQINESPIDSGVGAIANGDFELSAIANTPDSWIFEVGSPGTTVLLTNPTVQTVIISGTPTSGSYFLKFTNPFTSKVTATKTLAYNASAADVQSALREIEDLGLVGVVSTGTSPNFTHTITFTGFSGQVVAMTSTSSFDVGTIAHAVTTVGELGSNRGRSLVLKAHATELTTLYQEIAIQESTVYSMAFWMGANLGAFNIKISLVDGIGGSVINDDQGVAQEMILTAPTPIGRSHFQTFFRVAKNTPTPIYLKLEKTAPYLADDLVLDDFILAPASQIYPGGPYLSVHSGRIAPSVGDQWSIPIINNYAGEFQKYFDSAFDMSTLGLQLPTSGSFLILDSLIS